MNKVEYDSFLTEIYEYSPYLGKERREKNFATSFYLQALKNVDEKVLEFVTCTGLLTIPLAKENYKVDSVDISPYMHSYINKKLLNESEIVQNNISLYQCDVFKYKCSTKYKAIVIPDSFLLAVADKKKQLKLLKLCNSLLFMDGMVMLDIFQPWKEMISVKEKDQCTRFRLKNGEICIVNTHHSINPKTQIHSFEFEHKIRNNGLVYNKLSFRYMFQTELTFFLKEAGFEIISFDNTFNFNKYYAVIAKKIFEV